MTTPNDDPPVPVPVPVSVPNAKPKRKRGGVPVLDEKKKSEICAILAMGCPRIRAAEYVGCAQTTLNNTARRDPEFGIAMRQAEAQQEVSLVAHIRRASKDPHGWRAAAWLLQRMFPDRYARRADTMTHQQVAGILAQFADILTRGIRDAEDRTRVGNDLRQLTSILVAEGAGELPR